MRLEGVVLLLQDLVVGGEGVVLGLQEVEGGKELLVLRMREGMVTWLEMQSFWWARMACWYL